MWRFWLCRSHTKSTATLTSQSNAESIETSNTFELLNDDENGSDIFLKSQNEVKQCIHLMAMITLVMKKRKKSFDGETTTFKDHLVKKEMSALVQQASSSVNNQRDQQRNSNHLNDQRENQPSQSPTINNGAVILIGNSIIKHIEPRKLSKRQVYKHTYPGKRAEEIAKEIRSITHPQTNVSHVIIHAGPTIFQPISLNNVCKTLRI